MFREFAELIGLDFNHPTETEHDLQELFLRVADLPSWNKKMSPVKSGRWFSWNQVCVDQFEEFWASRMLLEFKYGKPEGTSQTFNELRLSGNGGLKLALLCLTWATWFNVQILRLGGKPLYDWYTRTVEAVRSPQQGLQQAFQMSQHWMSDQQLVEFLGKNQNEK